MTMHVSLAAWSFRWEMEIFSPSLAHKYRFLPSFIYRSRDNPILPWVILIIFSCHPAFPPYASRRISFSLEFSLLFRG